MELTAAILEKSEKKPRTNFVVHQKPPPKGKGAPPPLPGFPSPLREDTRRSRDSRPRSRDSSRRSQDSSPRSERPPAILGIPAAAPGILAGALGTAAPPRPQNDRKLRGLTKLPGFWPDSRVSGQNPGLGGTGSQFGHLRQAWRNMFNPPREHPAKRKMRSPVVSHLTMHHYRCAWKDAPLSSSQESAS